MTGRQLLRPRNPSSSKRRHQRKKSTIKVTQVDVKADRRKKRPKSIINTRAESPEEMEFTHGVILKKQILTSKFGKNFGSRPRLRKKNSEVALVKQRLNATQGMLYSRREVDVEYNTKDSPVRNRDQHRRVKTTSHYHQPQAFQASPANAKSPNGFFNVEKRDEYYQGAGNDLLSQTPTVHLNLDSQPNSYSNNPMVNKYLNINQPTRVKNPGFKASGSSSYLLQRNLNHQQRSGNANRLRQSHATLGRDAVEGIYAPSNYEQNKRKHQERMRNLRNSQVSNSMYQESAQRKKKTKPKKKHKKKASRQEDPYGSWRQEPQEYYEAEESPNVRSIVDKYSAYGPGYNIYQSSSTREQQTFFKKKGGY